MNKLNVAIKLIQLLNELKIVNTKIVADKLNVSLRTAQRYLLELSALPCVINLNNNHTYSLDPNYKISEAILNGNVVNHTDVPKPDLNSKVANTNQKICQICGQNVNFNKKNSRLFSCNNSSSSNYAIDKLVSIIKKKLERGKCKFPAQFKTY